MQTDRGEHRPADGVIAVGTDHAGLGLKDRVVAHLQTAGGRVRDFGAFSRDPDDDYPDIAFALGEAVARGTVQAGILVCGTGIGMSIAANKIAGARAALCLTREAAVLAREHNDANILVLAGRDARAEEPLAVVDAFVQTSFSGGERHRRRLKKIRDREQAAAQVGSTDRGAES